MEECIFCGIARHSAPAYIVYEDARMMAFLDSHPQTYGHLQLIPREHFTWIYDVPYVGDMFTTASTILRAIIPVLGASHATIATYGHQIRHAHVWLVPQYRHSVQLTEYGRDGESILAPHALTSLLQDTIKSSIHTEL